MSLKRAPETEKELVELFKVNLKSLGIEHYIHIPNSVFKGGRGDQKLKNVPDFIFPHAGRVWMVELGIAGRHIDRKESQFMEMQHWANNGEVHVAILSNFEAIEKYFGYLKKTNERK